MSPNSLNPLARISSDERIATACGVSRSGRGGDIEFTIFDWRIPVTVISSTCENALFDIAKALAMAVQSIFLLWIISFVPVRVENAEILNDYYC